MDAVRTTFELLALLGLIAWITAPSLKQSWLQATQPRPREAIAATPEEE